uniref:Uncharacterized protein n=1 Tax=Medicago truncatula TaxID=3880 RepID=I3SL48_MEDTR|nr:unknown [Medicago truncatula]
MRHRKHWKRLKHLRSFLPGRSHHWILRSIRLLMCGLLIRSYVCATFVEHF